MSSAPRLMTSRGAHAATAAAAMSCPPVSKHDSDDVMKQPDVDAANASPAAGSNPAVAAAAPAAATETPALEPAAAAAACQQSPTRQRRQPAPWRCLPTADVVPSAAAIVGTAAALARSPLRQRKQPAPRRCLPADAAANSSHTNMGPHVEEKDQQQLQEDGQQEGDEAMQDHGRRHAGASGTDEQGGAAAVVTDGTDMAGTPQAAGMAGGGQQRQQQEQQQQEDLQQEEGDGAQDQGGLPRTEFGADQEELPGIAVRDQGLAGQLHSIRLQNFMCYENFEMAFSNHVTVISGKNGSGKSAVLQGLQCCLGANARTTSRAASLQGLIRHGADSARVLLTLWNTGGDAYKPDLMGDTVTIERRISRRSSSTNWRVLDENMKSVPGMSSFGSVSEVLEHFGVNVLNPLAVMTQDTARSFLSGGMSDRGKHELFMQATMLGDFRARLDRATVLVNSMKASLASICSELKERREALKQLAARLQKLKGAGHLQSQRFNLERAVVWSCVDERAGVLSQLQQRLGVDLPGKRTFYEQHLHEVQGTLQDLQEEEQQKTTQQLEINRANQGFTAEIQQLTAAVRVARKALQEARQRQQQQKLEVAEDRLQAIVKAQMDSADESKRQLAQRLTHIQAQVEQASQRSVQMADEVTAQEEELHVVKQRVAELEQLHGEVVSSLEAQRRAIHQAQADKAAMLACQFDSIRAFGGPSTSQLHSAVKASISLFHKPPIGPIGAHLALDHPKWAAAVEHALQKHLHKWIVHDQHDEQLLRQLARQCGCDCSLVVLVYSYDVPRYEVPAAWLPGRQYTLLLNVVRLRVEAGLEHVLWNQMLDRANAANVALTDTDDAAADAAYSRHPNISAAFAANGTKYESLGLHRATIKSTNFFGRARLGVDPAVGMQQLEDHIAATQAKAQAAQQELTSLDTQLQTAHASTKRLHDQLHSKAKEQRNNQAILLQLQTQAQNTATEQAWADGDGEGLAGMLAELQEELGSSQRKLAEADGQLREAKEQEARACALHQQKADEIALATEEISTIISAVARIADEKAAAQKAAKQLQASLDNITEKSAKLEQLRADTAAEIALFRAQAEGVCSEEEGREAVEAVRIVMVARVSEQFDRQLEQQRRRSSSAEAEDVTPEQRQEAIEPELDKCMAHERLMAELSKVERALKRVEAEAGGSVEEVQLQQSTVQAEVDARSKVLDNLNATYKRLHKSLTIRAEAYQDIFGSVSRGVANKFHKHLAKRGHAGRIKVNEETCELQLQVMINGMLLLGEGQKAPVKDLKQLSGGERSLTTVAFALALGEWTESPFRVMDEFDVFMDAVARHTTVEALLKFAMDNDYLQLVLLTPLEARQVVQDARQHLATSCKMNIPAEFVRVVEMRPPRASTGL